MKIVVASAFPEKLVPALKAFDDWCFFTDDRKASLTEQFLEAESVDIIVCFGYGKLFSKSAIKRVRIINLHGGLLPWNRGPNPNLWSWIDNTPKGVTIHEVDEGVDTGPIIAQQEIMMSDQDETLQSSFDKIVQLTSLNFVKHWKAIRSGDYETKPQGGQGTIHKLADQRLFQSVLEANLGTRICHLLELIRSKRTAPAAS